MIKIISFTSSVSCPKNSLLSKLCIPELAQTLYSLAINGHLSTKEDLYRVAQILLINSSDKGEVKWNL